MHGGEAVSQRAVEALEVVVGQPLDAAFLRFVMHHNGATPDSNSFPVNGEAHMGGVDEFIPVEDIVAERSRINDLATGAYPVAFSSGGNYVLLDQGSEGAIFFWDHEVESGIYKIADTFEAFLDMLEPFDESTVKLEPGQVRSAWISPDFLKKLGG